MRIVFTLCSNNYLAQARTLGDSLLRFNPDIHFVIGLVDKRIDSIDYNAYKPFEIIAYDEIGFAVFPQMLTYYNIVEFNTAVKPFYFEFLFRRHEATKADILYIDPDIAIYKSLNGLYDLLKDHNFLLTPHIVHANPVVDHFEPIILNVGIYNLGFIGMRWNDETRRFLNWWQTRLITHCRIDLCKGLFVDQLWANYLPVLFKGVYQIDDPGYNMGYWNFQERKLSVQGGTYRVNDKYDLVFFHFSNFNPNDLKKISGYLKDTLDERPDLVRIYTEYRKTLFDNGYATLSKLERSLNFQLTHKVDQKKRKPTFRRRLGRFIQKRTNWVLVKLFDI